jgi:hypothetical protein
MASTLFSSKDLKPEQLNTFIQDVPQLEEKKTIIRNWQKAIANGKVQKSKEEQIKGEFLDKFFGQVLGYSYESHEAEWNLEKELKSIADNKKPDAALGFFDQKDTPDVRCVIEVKGALYNLDKKQNRADFTGSPVDQAFAYVPRMSGRCEWVIVTNMIEIRLYSRTDIGRYESFQIPELLLPNHLARFFYLLSYQQLFLKAGDSKIDQIFNNRIAEQKVIEKEFYNRYHELRVALFNNLRKQHPKIAPKKLFGLTQKLLDRLLFICFVRDRELLDANRFLNDVQQAVKRSFRKKKEAIWTEMKYFFTAMNEGLAEAERDIPEFNGGLFKEDDELNNLHIHDSQLTEIIHFVSSYNFDSQLDVNILGHIFEQSISDIEEFQQSFDEQTENEARTTKRKRDGIFYTPEYITRYMVKEAVGGWLDDRKKEILQELKLDTLPILSAEEIEAATVSPSEKVKTTIAFLERYREQLKKVKVVDPACGSGAFLNAVFDFLWLEWDVFMKEWNQLTRPWKDQLRDHAVAEPLEVYNGIDEWKIKKAIVANNIYGVDLNPESVEISKLSLWLKTANRKETLADLSANIKQGNSLIDDTKVAGDDAFNWNHAFAEIMKSGGFDVVVGNPPYATKMFLDTERDYFTRRYLTAEYQLDLYIAFMEKAVEINNTNGYMSFITPNSWLKNLLMSKCRKFLLDNVSFKNFVPRLENVFVDANVDTLIFISKKELSDSKLKVLVLEDGYFKVSHEIDQGRFLKNANYVFDVQSNESISTLLNKVKSNSTALQALFEISRGVNSYDKNRGQSEKTIATKAYHSNFKKDKTFVPELRGLHVNRYSYDWDGEHFISYGEWLAAPRDKKYFSGERIILRQVLGKHLQTTLIEEDFIIDQSVFIAVPKEESKIDLKFCLSILASKLLIFYFKYSSNEFDDLFPKIKIAEFKDLPVRKADKKKQQPLISRSEKMLLLHKSISEQLQNFIDLLRGNFVFEPTAKLKKWYTLEFIDLLAELEKGGAKLPPKKQGEWLELFKIEKEKIKTTQAQIDKTDKEIDQLVYALYELTPEEIAIVEKG